MTNDDVPALLPPDQMPAVLTPADLHRTWRALMGHLGFPDRTLWLLFIGPAGQPGPLLNVADLPDTPHGLGAGDLASLCREILDGPGAGGSVAMLMTRPGAAPWHLGDRAWARFLTEVAQRVGPPVWPVHRAHDRELVVVPDDPPDAGRGLRGSA